ncbi:membrane protein [Bacteroidia bacterium]|nr:membrane protein [Bacteroidia bacterium]
MNKKIFFPIAFLFLNVLFAQAAPSGNDSLTVLQKVERWYEHNTNYYSITALMAVESSFIPFPSEIVVPPAAYIASKPDSPLNIPLIVLFATLGSIIGAFINYFLALWLGRPFIYKFADSRLGHLCLLSKEKIQQAEDYFNEHGTTATFIGRLIPGIRQLISLPAGLARMNLVSFALYTTLGAGIWNIVLAALGYAAQGQADVINAYSHEIGLGIAGLIVAVALYLVVRKIWFKKRAGV